MNLNLNLKEFLKYLNRFKWLVISIPILCVVLTYFFVKTLPRKYKSSALISTGITNRADRTTLSADQSLDYFKLSQQFGNLLEMMKSKRIISQLSYDLIIHDLKNPNASFHKYPETVKNLSPQERQTAITEFEKRKFNNTLISVADNGKIKLYDIINAMGYSESGLLENLNVNRNGESDFIKVEYVSDNPFLSAFVVNDLSQNFINYYTDLTVSGQRKSLAILDTLVKEKQSEMLQKSSQLSSASASAAARAAGAMTAQRQSDIARQQVSEAQSQRLQAIRNISAIQGAISDIDNKLSGSGGYVSPNNPVDNTAIINIDNQIDIANRRYVNNNFRAEDKATLDSLQRIKSRLIASSASRSSGGNSAAIRQNLIDQKIKLESDLASAKASLATIENQLQSLGPAPVAGGITEVNAGSQESLLRDADMAAKDYADVQAQYEQVNMLAQSGIKLNLVEQGLPGPPEASKNILYLGFAGVSSLMLCLLTLLLAFMVNKTIFTAEQFTYATHQRVVGSIYNIKDEDKDLRNIWRDKSNNIGYASYKDSIRSLRFELIENLEGDNKVLGVTSLHDGEGKSFLSGSLSYAFAMMGKNVLLICEQNSSLMDIVTNKKSNDGPSTQIFESFLVKKEIQVEDRITILHTNPDNNSLLELRNGQSLAAGFKVLKDTFDVIIVDIDSTEDIHKVKEWLMFCDKSIAVFKSGNKLTDNDRKFVDYLAKHDGFIGWIINMVNGTINS